MLTLSTLRVDLTIDEECRRVVVVSAASSIVRPCSRFLFGFVKRSGIKDQTSNSSHSM